MEQHSKLFSPMRLGRYTLSHRIVFAPLTRFRVHDDSHIPLPFVKDYYAQRAAVAGTLLFTEGTVVSPRGNGWSNAPGIWNNQQISAWRDIVQAVHAKGCIIFMQLFASGRVASAEVLAKDNLVIKGPSAEPGVEELSEEEIQSYISEFKQAAKNAIEAGFDGVEVHGANGYLLDQFTQDTTNHRKDRWGGSIPNRARFALEITRAIVEAIGSDRVGFRMSPWSEFQNMRMHDVISQFCYLTEELNKLNLAYLHLIESRVSGGNDTEQTESLEPFTRLWSSTLLLAGGFKPASARETIEKYEQDVGIVFGRHFLANPDLVYRIQHDLPLNAYNRETFYLDKATEGYIDYPFSKQYLDAQGAQA